MSQTLREPDQAPHRPTADVLRRPPGADAVLTPEALGFVGALQAAFGERVEALLAARETRQAAFDAGALPDFLPETIDVRAGDWTVAPLPEALRDRRVEITGPVDRKMMINALNSGAKMFMADFEDASSPTFGNMVQGQVNMRDYARGRLDYTEPKSGKAYALGDATATMIVRPRGLHLPEANVTVDGAPVSAALFDFGLHAFHNAAMLHEQGRGPFYYLPKLESHLEARLWNDVFVAAQDALGLPQGTIKATVLIETLPAAFEMDEILHELRDHAAGLNCGRWDYIFSYIKTLRAHPDRVLPDRAEVGMDRAFLDAYSRLLIETCHRRGAHAMGGMAAQIPVKGDEAANEAAFAKVRADKLREVRAGHDGTWVAHPALVPVAMDVFDAHMPAANQVDAARAPTGIQAPDLLAPHEGHVTEGGIRTNIAVAIEYVAAWLCGRGAVPINNLMEDAATAEISRSQIWQWLRHEAVFAPEDGEARVFTRADFDRMLTEETDAMRARLGEDAYRTNRFEEATRLFTETATGDDLAPFLTLPAYAVLETDEPQN